MIQQYNNEIKTMKLRHIIIRIVLINPTNKRLNACPFQIQYTCGFAFSGKLLSREIIPPRHVYFFIDGSSSLRFCKLGKRNSAG